VNRKEKSIALQMADSCSVNATSAGKFCLARDFGTKATPSQPVPIPVFDLSQQLGPWADYTLLFSH
jgi:hypothetical protein